MRLDIDLVSEAMALEPYVKGVVEMKKSDGECLEHAA